MPPPKGWIRAIRDALGMTGVQLAKRLHVRPQTVEAQTVASSTACSIQTTLPLPCRPSAALRPRLEEHCALDALERSLSSWT